jgi:hypothetical protein
MMNEDKPRRIDGVMSKALGNETLLYWADGKRIHVLNRTARMIWELCDGQHTVQEIEQFIRREFQMPDPQTAGSQTDVASDIQRSLQTFVDAGLLVPSDGQVKSALTPTS